MLSGGWSQRLSETCRLSSILRDNPVRSDVFVIMQYYLHNAYGNHILLLFFIFVECKTLPDVGVFYVY